MNRSTAKPQSIPDESCDPERPSLGEQMADIKSHEEPSERGDHLKLLMTWPYKPWRCSKKKKKGNFFSGEGGGLSRRSATSLLYTSAPKSASSDLLGSHSQHKKVQKEAKSFINYRWAWIFTRHQVTVGLKIFKYLSTLSVDEWTQSLYRARGNDLKIDHCHLRKFLTELIWFQGFRNGNSWRNRGWIVFHPFVMCSLKARCLFFFFARP